MLKAEKNYRLKNKLWLTENNDWEQLAHQIGLES